MLQIDELRARLRSYLGSEISWIRPLAEGWETTILEFQLDVGGENLSRLPTRRPLVLRLYQGESAHAKAVREYRALSGLGQAKFPVPQVYLSERLRDPLDTPFLIMQRIEGGPLFGVESFTKAFARFTLAFFAFVRTQAQLHRIDPGTVDFGEVPSAFVPPDGSAINSPLTSRMLALIGERIERVPLPGLKPAWEVLQGKTGKSLPTPLSILHLDYHPQNVLVSGLRVAGVIDWVSTDVGDRHLDAATTATILSSTAMEHPRWMRENVIGNSLRTTFSSLYVPLYHAMAPLDWERFRYSRALASVLRLSMLATMRLHGAETVGFRHEAINEVTPSVIRLLTRYAERAAGTPITLDLGNERSA